MNSIYIIAMVSILLLGAGAIVYFFLLKKNESVLQLQAVQNPKVYLNDKEIVPVVKDTIVEYKMDKIKSDDRLRITVDFWSYDQNNGTSYGPSAGYASLRGVVDGKELPLNTLTYVTDPSFLGATVSVWGFAPLKIGDIEAKWMSNNFNAGWGTESQPIDVIYTGAQLQ